MNREPSPSAPPSLILAAAVTVVEGLSMIALAVLEMFSLTGGRLTMGLSTALFFAAFGVLLVACGRLITRGHLWARGPILIAQLIGLGLAWNLRGGETRLLPLALGLVGLVVIAAMAHPASIEALNRDDDRP